MIVEIIRPSNYDNVWYHDPKWKGIRFEVSYEPNEDLYVVIRCLHNELNKEIPKILEEIEKNPNEDFDGVLYLGPEDIEVFYNKSIRTVTINKGLPGSGKSTATREKIDKSNGNIKRVNRDDLRAMIDNSHWSKLNEELIKKIEMEIVLSALDSGYNVIIDDTNLVPQTVEWIKDFVGDKAEIIIDDSFLQVPLETCLERNAKREGIACVPEDRIREMYNKYVKTYPDKYVPDEKLPKTIIFDVDGTLAHMKREGEGSRSPYDWKKVGEDTVDSSVRSILNALMSYYTIVILTGRDESCLKETEQWLSDNKIHYDDIYIRAAGDMRNDAIIKKELFFDKVAPKYNVQGVFDDRDRVVQMWRELGIKCYQVNYGDF